MLTAASCAVPAGDDDVDLAETAQAIEDPDNPAPKTGPINPKPSNLYIDTNSGGRYITVRWNCGGNVETHRSYYQRNGGAWIAGDVSCNVSHVYGIDSIDVTPATPYCFKVAASNSTHSEWSNVVCATSDIYREPPAAPTMTVTAKPQRIEIRAVDRADIESGFRLYRKLATGSSWGSPIYTRGPASGVGDAISYDDASVASNTRYQYKLVAWHAWDTSEVIKTVDSWSTLPTAPSNVRFPTVAPTSLVVAWNDNSSNEDCFRVVYSAPGYGTSTKTLGANTTSTTISVGSGTTWTVHVIAYNEAGEASSPTVTVRTPETVPVGPDLVPVTVALQPAFPAPNQGMTFSWQECNTGATASSSARTVVRLDGAIVYDQSHTLAAKTCVTRSVQRSGLAEGSHRFEVWLDVDNAVFEAFEGNNYNSYGFDID
jgi:hypothetical protein